MECEEPSQAWLDSAGGRISTEEGTEGDRSEERHPYKERCCRLTERDGQEPGKRSISSLEDRGQTGGSSPGSAHNVMYSSVDLMAGCCPLGGGKVSGKLAIWIHD